MRLLLVFLLASFVLGARAVDTPDAPRLRLILVGAFVLGIGYLNLRMI